MKALGYLLIAAGFLLRPLIHELWQFYLFSGIVYVGMPGASILPAGRLVAAWGELRLVEDQ